MVTAGAVRSTVTALSVDVEAKLGSPPTLVKAPALTAAVITPSPVTVTTRVKTVPPASPARPWIEPGPEMTKSLTSVSVAGSLVWMSKTTAAPFVGSAWIDAWLIVTAGDAAWTTGGVASRTTKAVARSNATLTRTTRGSAARRAMTIWAGLRLDLVTDGSRGSPRSVAGYGAHVNRRC